MAMLECVCEERQLSGGNGLSGTEGIAVSVFANSSYPTRAASMRDAFNKPCSNGQ